MLYLQGMEDTPPEDDVASAMGSEMHRSSRSKSKAASSVRQMEHVVDDDNGEDIRSDIQEHPSELGRTIPIQTTGIVSRIPARSLPRRPKQCIPARTRTRP